MENAFANRSIHMGQNIQRFRRLRKMSQAVLALELEEKRNKSFSQQLVSTIEDKDTIDDEELLQQIAEILETSKEAIKTLDWDMAIKIMDNNYTNHNSRFSGAINQPINSTIHQSFNSLDKLVEFFEKEKTELNREIQVLKKEIECLKKDR